jgi:hypothetical protein
MAAMTPASAPSRPEFIRRLPEMVRFAVEACLDELAELPDDQDRRLVVAVLAVITKALIADGEQLQ